MRKNISNIFITLILTVFLILNSCNSNSNKNNNLIIFHAGSLSVPFKEIAKEFNKENPDINIIMEASGSRKCARKITDLNKECDIMASADYKVIDNLLIPNYASWNIKFAGNEMAIVYHENSRQSDSINANNWFDILLRDDVIFGRSNPNFDPCGYRTILVADLAEKYYNIIGLRDSLMSKNVNFVRPKEVDLLSLLKIDIIDYIFLYRSVAEQHGLKYILLPDSINLGSPSLSNYYQSASVNISGKKPGEVITKKGEPMVYGITILNNAPNKKAALKFVDFLLSKNKGMSIIQANGQKSLVPSQTTTYNKIPQELLKFTVK